MAIDTKKVTKDANKRTPDATYEKGEVKDLGSRVTSKQAKLVLDKLTNAQRKVLTEGEGALDTLRAYADTGDKSYVTSEQYEVLSKIVAQCKEDVAADDPKGSKARRFWPRKTAAIVVAHVAPYVEPEVSEDEQTGESSDESTEAAA